MSINDINIITNAITVTIIIIITIAIIIISLSSHYHYYYTKYNSTIASDALQYDTFNYFIRNEMKEKNKNNDLE